ncbi:hypothetical protein [Parasitella parasitica]|nr:hypothetical protein [Parasitella parasitica]
MLKPIQKPLAKILSYLFALTYQWSDWRHGNVCSIHKKGPVAEASSFRPISLTSTFRKLYESCLLPLVLDVSPAIDVAQNGFRSARSALDSALSFQDLMKDYQRRHYHWPTLCFLDIKSAYDVVDRRVIWQSMLSTNAPLPIVSLLSNLFDDVSISVLNQNCVSEELSPHKNNNPVHSFPISLSLWNANGLRQSVVHDVLSHVLSTHVLLVTETWLLFGSFPSDWSQSYLYGTKVPDAFGRGSGGMTAFVSPSCPFTVSQLPSYNPHTLSLKVGYLTVHCVYLPPPLSSYMVLSILRSLPLHCDTTVCGDFDARFGSLLGDTRANAWGNALLPWLGPQ